jgi:hypothetical protein
LTISINGAYKPYVATPVNMTYKFYLATISDVTEALFATPASAVHKPCLAYPVDVSQAFLGYPGIYIQLLSVRYHHHLAAKSLSNIHVLEVHHWFEL